MEPTHVALLARSRVHPDAASTGVQDAYWYAPRLINVGWAIRRIGITEQDGFFAAETLRRRVVSVDESAGARSDSAAQFAQRLTELAAAAAAEGRRI